MKYSLSLHYKRKDSQFFHTYNLSGKKRGNAVPTRPRPSTPPHIRKKFLFVFGV